MCCSIAIPLTHTFRLTVRIESEKSFPLSIIIVVVVSLNLNKNVLHDVSDASAEGKNCVA
jgi:hypothetical protein